MGKNTNSAITFYILTALYWFSVYSYASVLPNHAADMGAVKSVIGLITGSYGFTQMILRIPIGILSDKLDKRKIFIGLGLFIAFISSVGLAYAKTPVELVIFRGLAGVAVSTWVVFPGFISETYNTKNMHKAMGYMLAVASIGRMVAIALGGASADFFGVKWGFLTGALAALIGLLLYISLPSDIKREKKEKIHLTELLSVIKSRDLLFSSSLAVVFQFANFATSMTFTPLYARQIGMSETSIGLLISVFTLTGAVSSFLSGTVFKKYLGARRTIAWSFIVSGFMILTIPYVNSHIFMYIIQALTGFAMGVTLPLLMSMSLIGISGDKKSSAMGYFQAIYGIGMFMGPYVTGIISDMTTLRKGFAAVFAICMAGAVLSLIYLYTERQVMRRSN